MAHACARGGNADLRWSLLVVVSIAQAVVYVVAAQPLAVTQLLVPFLALVWHRAPSLADAPGSSG